MFGCDVCGQCFCLKSILKNHMKVHTKEKRHVCNKCAEVFEFRGELKLHTLRCHTSTVAVGAKYLGKNFECELCDKVFIAPSALKAHITCHAGEKPYSCQFETCGDRFSTKRALREHVKSTHSEEKNFVCDCGKVFERRDYFEKHKAAVHNKEKPYECDICGRCFADKSNALRHKLTHSGVKPHQCEICGKSFSQKFYLGVHMRAHTGEKPFACKICGKTFADSRVMKKHEKTH